MSRLFIMIFVCLVGAVPWKSVGCEVASAGQNHPVSLDLGILPIGATLRDASLFATTDCVPGDFERMADCSAVDRSGREYVFFDQRLARVSVSREANASLSLPGNIFIGQQFNAAVAAVERAINVKFRRAFAENGDAVAVTGYVVVATTGIVYSVELVSSSDGRLRKYIQRSEF